MSIAGTIAKASLAFSAVIFRTLHQQVLIIVACGWTMPIVIRTCHSNVGYAIVVHEAVVVQEIGPQPRRDRLLRRASNRSRVASRMFAKVGVWLCLLALIPRQQQQYFCTSYLALASDPQKQPDLYQLLGVSRSASVQEIKQAYRRKALDTHPDKNRHVPVEESAEAFRQVVHAFEILSDDASRKRYDRTGSTTTSATGNHHQHQQGGRQYRQQQQYSWSWSSSGGYRPVKLKDKFDVQQAQSRVLHVVSLPQLQTIILDDQDRLERNLLLCFTTPLTEQHADDEMVFPYPFAAMSSQGIWWEDLLQTMRIRFYKSSELSRFFDVTRDQADATPVFVFAKRGTQLTAETAPLLPRIATKNRQEFETWAWEQIRVEVVFVNHHSHSAEIYWVHGSKAHKRFDLAPGEESPIQITMLSHEWYVRDSRTDTHHNAPWRYKLTTECSLGSFKITSDNDNNNNNNNSSDDDANDGPQRLIIAANQCIDLSGHCQFWNNHDDACRTNPGFMWEFCQKTCGQCPQKPASSSSQSNPGANDEL